MAKCNSIRFWGDFKPGCQNHLLEKDVIHIANLECAFGAVGSTQKAYVNVCDTQELFSIVNYGYSVFSLANNHAADAGDGALLTAEKTLIQSGLKICGTINNPFCDIVCNKRTVRLIGAMQKGKKFSPHIIDLASIPNMLNQWRSGAHYIVLYAHWGIESEYIETPEPAIVRYGRKLIDLGVDCIIGTHSHVPQRMEYYKGKPIFYSLGNAAYTIEEGDRYPESKVGLSITVPMKTGIPNNVYLHAQYFRIDTQGNAVEKIERPLSVIRKNLLFIYGIKYYLIASRIYINKNVRSFIKRIKRYGIKHCAIFIAWLLYPKTLIYLFFYPGSLIVTRKKYE